MPQPDFLLDEPANGSRSPLTTVLAHGAGAPMDSPFMAMIAAGLAAAGWRVARFEFPYMAARRGGGPRRPPDRESVLLDCWQTVIDRLAGEAGPQGLVIGGKSMGGRMASLIADRAGVRGLLCLGYPFHPPGRPDRLRTAHLEAIAVPTLILQGDRDPLGSRAEIAGYALSPAIEVAFLPDGDHSFKPRKASGESEAGNLAAAIDRAAGWLARLA